MDAQERVLKVLNHEEPDKVPSFELSIDNLKIHEYFGEKYYLQGLVKSFIDTYDLYKGDIGQLTKTILAATESRSYIKNAVKQYLNLFARVGIELAQIPFSGYYLFPTICEKNYFVDEYGRIFDLRYNPSDNMDLAYYRGGYFKSFEDYETFPPLVPDSPRREKIFKLMKKTEKEYQGKVYAIPAIWGIFECSWQAFGFVNFSKILSKSKIIKKIIDDRGKFALELAKRFIEWGERGAIMIYDDLGYKSGLLTNPENYRKYVFPWFDQISKMAHKQGVKVILHSCGDIFPVFDDIIKAGIDAIHPIEPTTANPEYDIFKLNEKYGEKITFIGNISPQDLADKDAEYIKEYTKKLIKELAPEGGYILSSGHSINPAVKLENFLKMHETLNKYGIYPISIA